MGNGRNFEKHKNKRQMYDWWLGGLVGSINLSLNFEFFQCLPSRMCLGKKFETFLCQEILTCSFSCYAKKCSTEGFGYMGICLPE